MMNLDELAKQKADIVTRINASLKDDNTEAFQAAFLEYTNILQEAVMAEAKGLVQAADNQVLTGRGVRTLTSQETTYYQKLIGIMQQNEPKTGLDGYDAVLPETVIDAIFEDITEAHPLLSIIDFQNTSVLIKYLYSTMDTRHLATWGPLCGPISKTVQAEFKLLNLEQTKLSAWIPICKAMLDLGPAWLDRYVRTILAEAIANGLEDGIINGRGLAPNSSDPVIAEPIGMTRDLSNLNASTGYELKAATPIVDFRPDTYLALVADLVKIPIPKHLPGTAGADPGSTEAFYRRVTEVTLIVNPVDYLTKIIPCTIHKQPDGKYVSEIFPFPTRVVQSAYVAENTAVMGLPKRYLMALGVGTQGGRIEYSDEFKFLDDERVYLTKLYGTGRPLDNNSFTVLDITNVKPIVPPVRVTEVPEDMPEFPAFEWPPLPEYADTTLQALALTDGDDTPLDLDPAFSHVKYEYAAAKIEDATGTATFKLVATAADEVGATVAATLNGAEISNVNSIAFAEGNNTIIVTVTNGNATRAYSIHVEYEDISAA
jgi:hypothetical protein